MSTLINPTPLSGVGSLLMYPLFAFQSSVAPTILLDGNGIAVEQGGVRLALDLQGNSYPILGIGPQDTLTPAWIGEGRANVLNYGAYPVGAVTSSSGSTSLDTGSFGSGLYYNLVGSAGQILTSRYYVPDASCENPLNPPYVAVERFNDPLTPSYPRDGCNPVIILNLKIDDYRQPSGLYYNQVNPPEEGSLNYNNTGILFRVTKDSLPPQNQNYGVQGFDDEVTAQIIRGRPASATDANLYQAGPYEEYFPIACMGYDFSCEYLGLRGINCASYFYQDTGTFQVLPARMAQDQYLAALASNQGNTSVGYFYPNNVNLMPTRLLNSDSYIQTIWQPQIGIFETMQQYGSSPDYPEMQLPSVGFFGSDGSVSYDYVLPFDFVTDDIIQSPDLLWATPQGQVLAVYHSTDGTYRLYIAGTRTTYQSGMTNYRLKWGG